MKRSPSTWVWAFALAAMAALWASLRSPDRQMEYTLAALGLWGISFLINRYFKKKE